MSRLNVSHVVLSKRKLTKLVDTGKVRGWDDPRMPTISGLRRRGYSPSAVNAFCRDVGVTRNENFIEYSRLQHFARQDLEERADRRMAVREPLKVTLVGDASLFRTYDAPNHPTDSSRGTRPLTLTKVVYIEASDFREVDSKDFYGLALNKWARLRYCVCLRCISVEKDGITCEIAETIEKDPRGKLHWVSSDSMQCELRDYDHLFTVGKVDDEKWESQLSETSLVVRDKARVGAYGDFYRRHFSSSASGKSALGAPGLPPRLLLRGNFASGLLSSGRAAAGSLPQLLPCWTAAGGWENVRPQPTGQG